MKLRFSEEKKIQILQEGEAGQIREVCRKYDIAEGTYYRWRQEFQGVTAPQVRRLRQLEQENERLKRLVADQMLANEAIREVLAKKGLL